MADTRETHPRRRLSTQRQHTRFLPFKGRLKIWKLGFSAYAAKVGGVAQPRTRFGLFGKARIC
ncbi:UDP-N-acetylmuramoylalanine-D-glutamate ligase [Neisseria bacilliformis ATCC BAA-1200]|uniref:UDP-N-acetylmuramoylalanine-D-glutamate ligase n=1 Tax=Neisseria bacilliformis ATCC BAA-1200 TaxID=888742 RepID=F2BD84_9NEIS|nr:UDP-N-acetylmuramoylalanine-D-glutamate ligase [Neisseria bacilliformis ATCC BAA-1200]